MISNGEGSDMFIGWVSDSGPCQGGCIKDYWTTNYNGPVLDPTSQVFEQQKALFSINYNY